MAKGYSQFRLMLWQKFLRRRRSTVVMILEVGWPAFLFALVISIRQGSPAENRPQCFYPPRAMPSAGAIEFLQSHICNVNKRCSKHEQYNLGTHFIGLGGNANRRIEEKDKPISFETSSESNQVLPLIPKILTLFGLLSETITQPEVEQYLEYGPPKRLNQFIKDEKKVKAYLVQNSIIPEKLVDNVLGAELAATTGSDTNTASQLLDLKEILCDPVRLNETINLPRASRNELRQLSMELCSLNHSVVPGLTDLVLDQIQTDNVADELLGGVQTLTQYTTDDVIDDLSLFMETILGLKLVEPLIKEFPFIGNLDGIVRNVRDIVVESKNTRSFGDTMELVAPLVGNIINDDDYGRELANLAQSIDGISDFISKASGENDYKFKLENILEDQLSFQLFLSDYIDNSVRTTLLRGPDISPGRVRHLSDLMRLGDTWYNLTCDTPAFSSIFLPTDNQDHLDAIFEVQNKSCELTDINSLVQLSRLLDYRRLTQKMDSIQSSRMVDFTDYFSLVGYVTRATTSSVSLGTKSVNIVKGLFDGTSSIGSKFQRAFNISFKIDGTKDYSVVDVLDIMYGIINKAPEFRPLAAAVHLGRQVVMTSNNDFKEFKSLFDDPRTIAGVLLGSPALTQASVNALLGQDIDTNKLFQVQAGKTAKEAAAALCNGGQFLSLFKGFSDNDELETVQNVLCETDGMLRMTEDLNLNSLISNQVSNLLPPYMLYGKWWADTLRDADGVIEGIGSLMDLASGRKSFDGRVFLKLLYHTIAALGVQGRSQLSTNVPTLMKLIEDRVVEPPYFSDDLRKFSSGLQRLSIFQRKVPIHLSLTEDSKSPNKLISYLQTEGNLSPAVTDSILRSTLDFTLAYHIQDVEFNGEVCGPATIRQILKLPDISDDDLSDLTAKLCNMPREDLKDIARVIVPELDVGGLIKSLLDLSPTYLLKSSNLTKNETSYFVKNLGSLGKQLDGILNSIENKDQNGAESLVHKYGKTFCGDSQAFDFGSYGAALLTPSDDEDEEKENVEKPPEREPNWTPTQLKEIADFNDTFCVDLYKMINGLPGVGPVLWTFLKPLTQGRILYSPDTPEATAIMEKAYWLFDSVKDVTKLASTWIDFAHNISRNNEDRASRNKSTTLKELTDALKMPFVSDALRDTAGVDAEVLISQLPNSESITSEDLDQVTEVAEYILKFSNCIRYKLIPFESEKAMEEGAKEYLAENNLLAGIAFMNFPKRANWSNSNKVYLPPKVEYKIRMSVDHTMVPKALFDRIKKSAPDDDFLDSLRYFWGFLVMQDLVDQSIMSLHTGNESHLPKVYTQAFPYPCYDQDDFMVWSSFVIVIILLFSWLCMMAVGITSAVSEKEVGIEDTMMVMGMSGGVNRFAWFVNTLLGMIFLSAFLTSLIIGGKLTRFSDPILVFIWLSTYSVSIVMLCYLVSALVHKSTLASLIGLLAYIVLCIPFIILHSMDVVFSLGFRDKVLMSLSVTSAFCFGANELLVTEKNGFGITWDRAFVPTGDNFPFAWACIMSTIDSVIYGLIAWYISNKWPGQHGIPQPWYFPFSPYYWGIKKLETTNINVKNLDSENTNTRHRDSPPDGETSPPWRPEHIEMSRRFKVETTAPGEDEPENLPVGISMSKLTKVYNEGKKKAVDELSVNFYQGQITAFLGHNGAGKSTCIHMLTGLTPPTSGTAFIGGYNIRDGFEEIRKTLGYCPQHDVLFDYMSIKEHFEFYARMKSDKENVSLSEQVDGMLTLTGLKKFKDVPVNQLSGGQRRRVSVGCAFIGDSKYIILDEPTSGVDPAARRMIWDIIVKHKEGRTIILCTHHLDEADALGDRIVVVHQGRLITSGSSLWLKTQYGSGYHLTISKATGRTRHLSSMSSHSSQPRKWSTERLMDLVREHVRKAQVTEEIGTEVTIVLPHEQNQSTRFTELFNRLEAKSSELMVDKYGIADSTLEEIFLKVTKWATQHPGRPLDQRQIRAQVHQGTRESEENGPGDAEDSGYDNHGFNSDSNSHNSGSYQRHSSSRYDTPSRTYSHINSGHSSYSSSSKSSSIYFQNDKHKFIDKRRSKGFALTWRQFKALLLKRFHHYRRDLKSHVSQVILPSVFVCIAMVATMFNPSLGTVDPFYLDASIYGPNQTILFSMENHSEFGEAMINTLKVAPGMGTICANPTIINEPLWDWLKKECHDNDVDFEKVEIPLVKMLKLQDPPNCTCGNGPWTCPDGAMGLPPPELRTHAGDRVVDLTGEQFGMEQYALRSFDQFKNSEVGGTYGGWSLDRSENYTKATVWYNSKGIHAVPAFSNALNNMAYRANIGMKKDKGNAADYSIVVHNHPFQATDWPITTNGLFMRFSDTGVSLTILIAYCFVPASYIIYIINERISQEKRLQAITGVGTFLYWFNALLWDMMTYVLTLSLTVAITKGFSLHVYTYGENLHALATILILFGWATIPMMYLLSRWFDNPTTGYVAAFIINLAIGINCTACIFFLQTPIFNSRKEIVAARDILTKAFLIFPQFCLGDALVKIAYNQIITDIFIRFNIHSYTSPFDKSLMFYHFLVLAVEGVVLFLIHLVIEFELCDRSRKAHRVNNYKEDEDVSCERQRVMSKRPDDFLVTIYRLTKYYRRGFRTNLAVDNLCLGIPRGECFGLLGINGAGKTTTFKMITGEIPLSAGAVFLNGEIISEDVSNMNQNVGYCPQFDALDDFLSGEEMIYYYCRLRGIPEEDISGICSDLVRKFQLEAHYKYTVRTYSAGNKRKLSTAMALIGDPDIVLLDEPTTGMDPGTRRLVWDNITAVIKDGRSVILTSHSMEECDALCTRMAIMVNGTFKCLGSSQHLKNRFGSGYTMSCRVGGGADNARKVEAYMKRRFSGAWVKDRHLNMLEFGIPARSSTLAALFGRIEKEKTRLKIENYSVTQTTLDNVFLNFAKYQSDDRVFSGSMDNIGDEFDELDDLDDQDPMDMEDVESAGGTGSTSSTGGQRPDSSAPPSYHPDAIAPNAYNIRHISRSPEHPGLPSDSGHSDTIPASSSIEDDARSTSTAGSRMSGPARSAVESVTLSNASSIESLNV